MRQWKEAGRAGRDDEAELWKRFRDAQDKFFAARSEVFAAKETELRAHASVKEQLLAEAQALLPITDWRAARSALRGVQERWEQAGPVPRESRDQLEQGLRKVEEAVRRAEENQWKRSNPEALARAEGTVNQLRTAIENLESQLAKAQARGDAKGISNAEEALAARRSWLAEAERTLAEFSG
jgi:DNA repair exonuclease SbcCD ATPase subunit